MKNTARTFSIIIGVTAVIFIAGLVAPFFINDYVEEKIISAVDDLDEFPYTLETEGLSLGIWSRTITLDSVKLIPQENATFQIIKAERLKVGGISWFSLINNSYPDFQSIYLSKPSVKLKSKDLSFFSALSDNKNSKSQSYTTTDPSPVFDLEINGAFIMIEDPNGHTLLKLGSLDLEIENLNLNAIQDSSQFLSTRIYFTAQDISGQLAKQLYRFDVAEAKLNGKKLSISEMELTPVLPIYGFSEARGKQIDRLELRIPQVRVSGVETDSIPKGNINIDSLIIDDAHLEVFRNKQIPRSPSDTLKPLVNDMASSIPFPFQLNAAVVNNATIIYSEHRPPSDTSASVSFNKLNGVITNFSSSSHPSFTKDTLLLHAETMFMNEALLTVDVQYPIFREDDHHSVSAQLNSIDPKAAQEMLQYVGFVKINDGMVHSLETKFSLDDTSAEGDVTIIYSDLDIGLVNKSNPDQRGVKETVTDFLTDHFVLESENPAEDPRIGKISFEREREKSIFAYWWKSLLSGIKDSIK